MWFFSLILRCDASASSYVYRCMAIRFLRWYSLNFGYAVTLHRTSCISRPLAMMNSWATSFGSAWLHNMLWQCNLELTTSVVHLVALIQMNIYNRWLDLLDRPLLTNMIHFFHPTYFSVMYDTSALQNVVQVDNRSFRIASSIDGIHPILLSWFDSTVLIASYPLSHYSHC